MAGDVIVGVLEGDDVIDHWDDKVGGWWQVTKGAHKLSEREKYYVDMKSLPPHSTGRDADECFTPSWSNYHEVLVLRDSAFLDRHGWMVSSKPEDRFPGSCPSCGRKAYVSALSVEHRNEEMAKDCTVRRA